MGSEHKVRSRGSGPEIVGYLWIACIGFRIRSYSKVVVWAGGNGGCPRLQNRLDRPR
jgi:hypothetical protein